MAAIELKIDENNLLGEGGFGKVFKGFLGPERKEVAVKILENLSPDAEARFLREQKVMMHLSQDVQFSVPILANGRYNNHPFFVMPYYKHGSLDRYLKRRTIPPLQAVQLIASIARVIELAHQRGIIHNDLKPSNILVDDDHNLVISDWGLAYIQDGQDLTATGQILGTDWYRAPEIGFNTDARKTPASDVFSLGRILDRMTDRSNSDVNRLIDEMTAQSQLQRIQSCEEVLARIHSICSPSVQISRSDAAATSRQKAAQRDLLAILFVGLATAVATGVIAASTLKHLK